MELVGVCAQGKSPVRFANRIKKKIVKKMKKPKRPTEVTKESPIEAESIIVTEETIEQIPTELTEVVPETEEETILSVEEIEKNQPRV